MYDLRYKKKAEYGFEGHWNQATHLITTQRNYRTDSSNFNFVFSDHQDRFSQWQHLYWQLPILFLHAVEVVDALFASLEEWDEDMLDLERLRRLTGFGIWADQAHGADADESLLACLPGSWQDRARLGCRNCKNEIPLDIKDALRFFLKRRIRCAYCGEQHDPIEFFDTAEPESRDGD